jgi:hypothetical protein
MTDRSPRRSRRGVSLLPALLLLASAGFAGAATYPTVNRADYVTSEKCATCHQTAYKGWQKTFHATVIKDAKKDPSVILADMSDPDLPFRLSEIYYTIGGHWDQRYLTKIDNDYYILPRLWSIQSRKWRPYSTYGWQKRPYSKYCVGCHSVGFDANTGENVEHAIGCESCHGPGAAHASDPDHGKIVNPANLSPERNKDICAACHVRGKDLSDEYYFPIGWVAGKDLAEYLVPIEKKEGESNGDAITRLWNKWKADRDAQARSRCEVCGIHQGSAPKSRTAKVDGICLSCHEFEDRLEQHSHHKDDWNVSCSDCHQQRDPEELLNENRDKDVHSYSYFLVHAQNCWDKEYWKKCLKCHTGKDDKWAQDTTDGWKKPVIINH